MKTKKMIAGIAVGAVLALILFPKTRKMLSDAVCSITDALKDVAGKTDIAGKAADMVKSRA